MKDKKRLISKSKSYGFNPWVDQVDAINQIMKETGESHESVVLRALVDEALEARRKKRLSVPLTESDNEAGRRLQVIESLLMRIVEQGDTSFRIQDMCLALLQDVLAEAHALRRLSWESLAMPQLREKGADEKERLLVRNRDGCEEVRKDDLYNVPRFLNRILALNVEDQNALFDHFADLFDQTVRYAKANGTFDEGVTDIKALAIRIAKPPRVVHTDEITQARTTHYTLEIDVPSAAVSFDEAEQVRKRRNGAFFRHRKNSQFILAVESGLHTNAETGNSYRSFAVWKPEAARSTYIHSDELTEKYTAVTPAKARDWWNDKYANVPSVETHEIHIIGGAIIPLWQRFKTHEKARLRVVRVTTDEGQRIVGIRIPSEQVGPIVRALGASRDLREPEEIFAGILNGGEEVTLVSGLKLCRRTLHREPVIELIGVDPYKFADIRGLGLINEQIDWKQRFFVPTDEERGIAVLDILLARYPIVPDELFGEWKITSIEPKELATSPTVNLEEWCVPFTQTAPATFLMPDENEDVEPASGVSPFRLVPAAAPSQRIPETQLALNFG